jgi:hypothetical protein
MLCFLRHPTVQLETVNFDTLHSTYSKGSVQADIELPSPIGGLQPIRENIQLYKTFNFFLFTFFWGSYCRLYVRIRNFETWCSDLFGTHLNPDYRYFELSTVLITIYLLGFTRTIFKRIRNYLGLLALGKALLNNFYDYKKAALFRAQSTFRLLL